MGLFSNKEEEEKNEFGFIGDSEWMNEQAKTAKAFNEEDDKMGWTEHKPKQARLFIAIEDNGKTDSVAIAIKTNDPRLLTRALYKIGQKDETFAKFLKLAAAKLGFMEKLEHDNEMTASSKELMKHLIEII